LLWLVRVGMKVKPWSWYFWAALAMIEGIQAYAYYHYGVFARSELFGVTFVFCVGCGLYSFLNRKPKPP